MTTVAIIQARMGSSRLPGKVLMDIAGKPMLQRVIERTQEAGFKTVVATSHLDFEIPHFCKRLSVPCYQGDLRNVLERFIKVATEEDADRVIRITGDCPLIRPMLIRKVVEAHTADVDYASNVFPRSFPKGLDCEAVWFDVLLKLRRISKEDELEHVTAAIRRRPELFSIANVIDTVDRHTENVSVDTQEDLDRVRGIYEVL